MARNSRIFSNVHIGRVSFEEQCELDLVCRHEARQHASDRHKLRGRSKGNDHSWKSETMMTRNWMRHLDRVPEIETFDEMALRFQIVEDQLQFKLEMENKRKDFKKEDQERISLYELNNDPIDLRVRYDSGDFYRPFSTFNRYDDTGFYKDPRRKVDQLVYAVGSEYFPISSEDPEPKATAAFYGIEYVEEVQKSVRIDFRDEDDWGDGDIFYDDYRACRDCGSVGCSGGCLDDSGCWECGGPHRDGACLERSHVLNDLQARDADEFYEEWNPTGHDPRSSWDKINDREFNLWLDEELKEEAVLNKSLVKNGLPAVDYKTLQDWFNLYLQERNEEPKLKVVCKRDRQGRKISAAA